MGRKSICLLTLFFLVGCLNLSDNFQPTAQVTEIQPVASDARDSTAPEIEFDRERPCTNQAVTCIGFMTDGNQLDDGSFYQAVWQGVERTKSDLAATVTYAEPASPEDYTLQFEQFAAEGYDIVVTAGHGLLLPTLKAAETYSDVKFIGIDQSQYVLSDNLTNVIFPQEKAGFLAGVLAGSLTKTKVVGVILGTVQSPTFRGYRKGFEAGVAAVDASVKVISLYHPGEITQAQNDPQWGAETARFMIANQADVVFAAGGETAAGALIEVAQNSSAFCIGAELDQFELVPDAQSCLVSSAIRDVEQEVFTSIAYAVVDQQQAGNYEGGFELAPFHDFDPYFSADVKLFFKDLEDRLSKGIIPTDGSYRIQKPPEIIIP